MRFSFFRLVRFLPWTLVLLFFQADLFGRCGVQRWDVKTGKDAEAFSIDLTSPTPTTIAFLTDLTRFPPPPTWPPPARITPVEMTAWTLDAILDSFKFATLRPATATTT